METATPHIEMRPVAALKPYPGNARTHSRKQVRQIADSIARFGFTNPVLISDDSEIVAGHGRVLAARQLGLDAVPTVRLSHLSKEERRAYLLADNKLAQNAGWDAEILAIEAQFRQEQLEQLNLTPAQDAAKQSMPPALIRALKLAQDARDEAAGKAAPGGAAAQ